MILAKSFQKMSNCLREDTPSAFQLAGMHCDDTDFAAARDLYLSAFPREERREVYDWERLATERSDTFSIRGIYDCRGQRPLWAGFLSTWRFDRFSYVEHFATAPNLRGGGIGTTTLRLLQQAEGDRPIVLEVEPPTTETARRRIAFYERNGFSLCERAYVQPPYRPWEETEGLTLLLMTTAPDFLEEHFDEVRATIHAEVYGVTGD